MRREISALQRQCISRGVYLRGSRLSRCLFFGLNGAGRPEKSEAEWETARFEIPMNWLESVT